MQNAADNIGLPLTGGHKTAGYALVTGASSGLGLEFARRLAGMGYGIIMAALDDTKLEEAFAIISSTSESLNAPPPVKIGMDLGRYDSADRLIERVGDLPVEILINDAGIFGYAPLWEWPEAKLHLIMAIHDVTPVILCRHYSEMMKARGRGYILNISSLAAWLPFPGLTMYSATKSFLRTFSRSLKIELMGTGVSVTAAYFGAVDTGLYPLSDSLRGVARRIGVMVTPEKAVSKALDAMFKGRSGVTPGLFNRLAKPFFGSLSERTLHRIDKKYGKTISGYASGKKSAGPAEESEKRK